MQLKALQFFAFILKGDDDVALCGIKDGKPIMHHMRNERKAPPSLLDEKNPQVGFSDVKVVLEKDVLVCSFTRVSQMPNVVHYFNTNEEHGYHVLFASGTYVDGSIFFTFSIWQEFFTGGLFG